MAADARELEEELAAKAAADRAKAKVQAERERAAAAAAREDLQRLRAEAAREREKQEVLALSAKERGQRGLRADGVTALDPRSLERSGKQALGRKKKRAERRKREAALTQREEAAVAAEQRAAALVAAAEEQAAAQGVSEIAWAASAISAITETEQRKWAEKQLGALKRGATALEQAAAEPQRVRQRLTGAAAELVSDTKKVTRDAKQREKQTQRQRQAGQRTARGWQLAKTVYQKCGMANDRQGSCRERIYCYGTICFYLEQ